MTRQTSGSAPDNSKTGITLSMITDGTSKTFSPAETHEIPQSAWIDSSRTSVTTATGRGTVNSTPRAWTVTSDRSTVKSTRTCTSRYTPEPIARAWPRRREFPQRPTQAVNFIMISSTSRPPCNGRP